MICGEKRAKKQRSQQRSGIFEWLLLISPPRSGSKTEGEAQKGGFAKLGHEQALTEGKLARRILLLVGFREEKAMAPHSSTLAWKIPWMEEPGRLQSMRSLRVGLD